MMKTDHSDHLLGWLFLGHGAEIYPPPPLHASPATFLESRGTRLKEQDNKSTQYRVRRERKGVSFSVHTGRVIPGHPLDLAQPRFPGLHAED